MYRKIQVRNHSTAFSTQKFSVKENRRKDKIKELKYKYCNVTYELELSVWTLDYFVFYFLALSTEKAWNQ